MVESRWGAREDSESDDDSEDYDDPDAGARGLGVDERNDTRRSRATRTPSGWNTPDGRAVVRRAVAAPDGDPDRPEGRIFVIIRFGNARADG